jgi:hypothetical protein
MLRRVLGLHPIEALEPRDLPATAFQNFPIIPADQAALDHARAIAVVGQTDGRRTNAFMDIGDSISQEFNPYLDGGVTGYLAPLGAPGYNPVASGLAASYPQLLGTLATFQAPVPGGTNSFYHTSLSAVAGYNASNALATFPSELAVTDAGIALIMIGTNNLEVTPPSTFQAEIQTLVQGLAADGVVPVLSTIPDNYRSSTFESSVFALNQAIANVADQDNIPLWNAWLGLQSLPNHGVRTFDETHLTVSPNGGGSFGPTDLLYGENLRNLEALQVLNWYQTQVLGRPSRRCRAGHRSSPGNRCMPSAWGKAKHPRFRSTTPRPARRSTGSWRSPRRSAAECGWPSPTRTGMASRTSSSGPARAAVPK